MLERNTPQKTLESWKQIAAFLDRSERTVRRWATNEGLPIHRREHQKHDTVFAFKHEIEAWTRRVHRPYRTRLCMGHGERAGA
jgi:phage terminase Nu1 subunit (DNA packaging protein)